MQVKKISGSFGSFALAATAVFAQTINYAFSESFSTSRLGAVLLVLILLHLLRFPRLIIYRELALYSIFVGYMVIALLWTDDIHLAMNTLTPAFNFIFLLILFGGLVAYHDLRAVFAGTFSGFLIGAIVYTLMTGFPFVRPFDISYNAVGTVYLFGLFITLTLGWFTGATAWIASIGTVIWIHIVATTSIKANLGVLLGAAAASLAYFKYFARGLRRSAIPLLVIVLAIVLAVASDDSLVKMFERGVDRVTLGIEIMRAGIDLPGYSGFEERIWWTKRAIDGWAKHPLFGNGIEAFRSDYGITSHSSPNDLLYNTGLTGLLLFYGVLVSLGWRVLRACKDSPVGLRALTLGALVCFLVMLPAGNLFYSGYLAIIIAISAVLLDRNPWSAAPAHASLDSQ